MPVRKRSSVKPDRVNPARPPRRRSPREIVIERTAPTYRATCPCGWDGPERQTKTEAIEDAYGHRALDWNCYVDQPNAS